MHEFVLQRREVLSEFVVQLTRDDGAFLLARQRNAGRKPTKLRSGGMRLVVGRIPHRGLMCSRRHRPRRYSGWTYLSSDRNTACRTDAVSYFFTLLKAIS